MLGFGKKQVLLVFLNNFKLRFLIYDFLSNNTQQLEAEEIVFPEDIIQDGAISKGEAFAARVSEFLKTKPDWRKLDVLLVIPEEKIFLKGFELDLGDLDKKEQLRKDFISEVPFLENELIIKESLSGRVLEFSAISRKYLEDLQKPFLDEKFSIAGAIAIPQVLASDLAPKAKTILMTFYDNDLVLVLSENSKVLFSETERLKPKELVKNIISSLEHFKVHPLAKEINSLMLVLDPDLPENILVQKMEDAKYSVLSVKKANFFDLVADYFQRNASDRKRWDLLLEGRGTLIGMMTAESKKYWLLAILLVLLAGLLGGGAWWYQKIFLPKLLQPVPEIEVPAPREEKEVPPETPAPVPEPAPAPKAKEPKPAEPQPVKKENFPIRIFNGTKVVGEASRLSSALQSRGFTVSSVGNHEDQNQSATTLFVQASTPSELISELRSALETYYQTVLVSQSPISEDGVIHIVIGRKK